MIAIYIYVIDAVRGESWHDGSLYSLSLLVVNICIRPHPTSHKQSPNRQLFKQKIRKEIMSNRVSQIVPDPGCTGRYICICPFTRQPTLQYSWRTLSYRPTNQNKCKRPCIVLYACVWNTQTICFFFVVAVRIYQADQQFVLTFLYYASKKKISLKQKSFLSNGGVMAIAVNPFFYLLLLEKQREQRKGKSMFFSTCLRVVLMDLVCGGDWRLR